MFHALWRGLPRIATLVLIGAIFLIAQTHFPLALGPVLSPIFLGFAITFLALAAGEVAVRIAQPRVDAQKIALDAVKTRDIAAGLVYLGRNLLVATVLLIVAMKAGAATPPPTAALPLLPIVKAEQIALWQGMPLPSVLGAQIHQETGGTWSKTAMLKTKRERGFGLGQFTIAYRDNGSVRFDALAELIAQNPKQMAGVTWAVYEQDARVQIRAMVLKDLHSYQFVSRLGFTGVDAVKAMASAYNGGDGAVRSDQAACRGTRGCDPTKWDGHVATTSLKAKTAVPGYGKPFFQINREYADLLVNLQPRRARYVPYLEA